MVGPHPLDGHPPSKTYQKEVYYRLAIWQLELSHKIKTSWSAMDGQPPSPGWSPTIPRMVTHPPSKIYQKEKYFRLEIWHVDLAQKNKTRWSTMDFSATIPRIVTHHPSQGWSPIIPRMVTHHPKDGYPPSKIKTYHNEMYYRLGIWHIDLIHKIKIRWQLPWLVSCYPQDGPPPSHGWSLTIQNLPEGNVLQAWNLASILNSQN